MRTDQTTDDDTPKFFHYVKKNEIIESAVAGKVVVALCGETFPVRKQAKPGPGMPGLRADLPVLAQAVGAPLVTPVPSRSSQ